MGVTTRMEVQMAAITIAPQEAVVPKLGYALLLGAVLVLWMVTFEAGPVSHSLGQAGTFLHEFFHDGRHLLGVPCH